MHKHRVKIKLKSIQFLKNTLKLMVCSAGLSAILQSMSNFIPHISPFIQWDQNMK